MNQKLFLIISLFLLPLFLSACMLFPATAIPSVQIPLGEGAIHTAAAETIVAQLTQSAGSTAVAQLTQMATGGQPTQVATAIAPVASPTPPFSLPATAVPTATPLPLVLPTATPYPTWTAIPPVPMPIPPTWAPPPPPPPMPLPTLAPVACDWAQFLRDVSIPDGSLLAPGQSFSKTWRLRNIGSCTWNGSYDLVFVSGDRMQVHNVYGLPGIVRPGETVDVTADFVAPVVGGSYRGYWMLSNSYGRTFGIGPDTQRPFWVDIAVRTTDTGQAGYNFVTNYCNAQWHNGYDALPCPGDSDDPSGSVRRVNSPVLETGKHENEPALWTRPYASRDGMISGTYPAFKIQAGDRFLADIGCLENSKSCDVVFYLDYQIGGQPVHNLGSWHEVYDRMINRVEVDLSGLAGKNVQFILRVENRGKVADANAFWLGAQVRRTGTGPVDPGSGNLPPALATIQTLAHDLGVPANWVTITQVDAVQWPDACLGISRPGQLCAQVVTPGYRVLAVVQGRTYEVHTNQDASIVLWVSL